MCLLLESILLKNGDFPLLSLHQNRMNTSQLSLDISSKLDLTSHLSALNFPIKHSYKCRVLYREKIEKVEFIPYQIKEVNSFQLVKIDQLDYSLKWANRIEIELLSPSGSVPIFVQDNKITDSSYANLAFYNGEEWHTPASFLLNGIKRQKLLQEGILTETLIRLKDLKNYRQFKQINAMMTWEEAPIYDISTILK